MRDTIIVTGSRDFVDLIVLEDAMLRAFSVMGSDRIVHGGARGADSMAETWGHMHGSPSRRIRSTTSSTGRGSGTARVKP